MTGLQHFSTALDERAFATWDRIMESLVSGVHPVEDGLTADHLSALGAGFGDHLRVRVFRGPGEGGVDKPNADWEWWIGAGNKWVGLRVQAKLLDVHDVLMKDFGSAAKREKAKNQARRLIENRYDTPGEPELHVYRFPIYCFYLAWQEDPPIPAEDGYAARQYGCSLLSAVHVLEQLEGGHAALEHYAHALVPWSALFRPAITVLSMRRRLTSLFSRPLSRPVPTEPGPFATHPPSWLEGPADAGPPSGSKPRRRLADAVASVLPRRDEGTVGTEDLPSYAREMARSPHRPIRVETDLDDEMPDAVVVANTQPLGAG